MTLRSCIYAVNCEGDVLNGNQFHSSRKVFPINIQILNFKKWGTELLKDILDISYYKNKNGVRFICNGNKCSTTTSYISYRRNKGEDSYIYEYPFNLPKHIRPKQSIRFICCKKTVWTKNWSVLQLQIYRSTYQLCVPTLNILGESYLAKKVVAVLTSDWLKKMTCLWIGLIATMKSMGTEYLSDLKCIFWICHCFVWKRYASGSWTALYVFWRKCARLWRMLRHWRSKKSFLKLARTL